MEFKLKICTRIKKTLPVQIFIEVITFDIWSWRKISSYTWQREIPVPSTPGRLILQFSKL